MLAFAALVLSAAVQSGPVIHLKGDDGAAPAAAADSSGNGTNGVYTNGATTSAVAPTVLFPDPTSMIFDGVNDLVDVSTFSWPAGGPVTVAFWNHVATADIRQANAFAVGNADDPNRFQCHAPYNDHILYWDYGDRTATGRVSINYDPWLDRWTHVVLVSEGNGGSFKAIYLDGVLVASAAVSDGPDVPLSGMTIGAWLLHSNQHKGNIDDFRIYGRVLTPAQIQLLASGNTEPPQIAALTATGLNARIRLTWTAVAGATSYNVKRSLTPGGPYATIATVGATTYDDHVLKPGVPGYYVVSGVGVSEGPDSNEASGFAGSQSILVKGCGALGLELLLILAAARMARR